MAQFVRDHSEGQSQDCSDLIRRREQARIRQRRYRQSIVRIDFHPDQTAVQVIDPLRSGCAGGDASSIINRIIAEWSAQQE